MPGAIIIVATGVLRLSYFNVFGLVDESTYMGLALDNNIIILTYVFLFNGMVDQPIFTAALYFLLMALAALNVAPIRTPKFAGRWYLRSHALHLDPHRDTWWQLLHIQEG